MLEIIDIFLELGKYLENAQSFEEFLKTSKHFDKLLKIVKALKKY